MSFYKNGILALNIEMILTNDNPRSENPSKIADAVLLGIQNADAVKIELDRKVAIECAIQAANQDDFILIAGKGHEQYQIFGEEKKAFSDSQVVIQQLRLRDS